MCLCVCMCVYVCVCVCVFCWICCRSSRADIFRTQLRLFSFQNDSYCSPHKDSTCTCTLTRARAMTPSVFLPSINCFCQMRPAGRSGFSEGVIAGYHGDVSAVHCCSSDTAEPSRTDPGRAELIQAKQSQVTSCCHSWWFAEPIQVNPG